MKQAKEKFTQWRLRIYTKQGQNEWVGIKPEDPKHKEKILRALEKMGITKKDD